MLHQQQRFFGQDITNGALVTHQKTATILLGKNKSTATNASDCDLTKQMVVDYDDDSKLMDEDCDSNMVDIIVPDPDTNDDASETEPETETDTYSYTDTDTDTETNNHNMNTKTNHRLRESEEVDFDSEDLSIADVTDDDNNDNEDDLDFAFEIISAPVVSKWDQANLDNDIYVSAYADEIVSNMRESESKECCEDYMAHQSDVNQRMRNILVDWLVDVHRKFKLFPSTLFLTLNLLDRYLSKKKNMHRTKLQLLGCVCLWIASKYHEIYAPAKEDFVYISDNAFTVQNMMDFEIHLFQLLQITLTVPTVYSYIQRYSVIASYYLESKREQKMINDLMQFCIENAAVSYKLSRCRPSLVAAAAFVYVCIGTKVFDFEQFKNDNISKTIGYEMPELSETIFTLHNLVRKCRKSKFQAIHKKYASITLSKVSYLNFNKLNIQKLISGASRLSSSNMI
jgi:cyclin B